MVYPWLMALAAEYDYTMDKSCLWLICITLY